MSHYTFETDAGVGDQPPVTHSFQSLKEARIEAIKYLGELLAGDGSEFESRRKCR